MKFYLIATKRTEENYNNMEKVLRDQEYEVLNAWKVEKQLPQMDHTGRTRLMHALIDNADAVFVERDWEKDVDAESELYYALQKNKHIVFEAREEIPFE